MQRLDGAEICHPSIFVYEEGQRDLERFAARAPMATIGSSDFHGLGPMGICRTYVFASAATEQGILDGVRAHRTVAYGRAYGDPALVGLAADAGGLRDREPWPAADGMARLGQPDRRRAGSWRSDLRPKPSGILTGEPCHTAMRTATATIRQRCPPERWVRRLP
jgi:hypothetical protein